jgi:hypothetical protein
MTLVGGPQASRSSSTGLAIANVLRTGVQLNGDGLDPPHGLVATAAAQIGRGDRWVVVEKLEIRTVLRPPALELPLPTYLAGEYSPSLATEVGNLVIACFTLALRLTSITRSLSPGRQADSDE